jgi:hypothetical protein
MSLVEDRRVMGFAAASIWGRGVLGMLCKLASGVWSVAKASILIVTL